MDQGFVMEDFTAPVAQPETGFSMIDKVVGWGMSLTPKQIAFIILIGFCLRLAFNHKKIMAEVRCGILTVEGFILSAIHAVIVIGVVKVVQTFI